MDEMETVITMDTTKDMEGVDIGAIMVIDTRRRITTEAERRPIIETVELRPVRANRSRTTAGLCVNVYHIRESSSKDLPKIYSRLPQDFFVFYLLPKIYSV